MGPGVLMTAFMLALIIYYVLGYTDDDITFLQSLVLGIFYLFLDTIFYIIIILKFFLILGTILATTDPVAVVALLKELGAPLHIETLIEMESLFNDGVAMVFYIMFIDMAKGSEANGGEIIKQFFQLAAGGPALGYQKIYILLFLKKKNIYIYIYIYLF